jgi:serine/threonine protein phosphatase PrpC
MASALKVQHGVQHAALSDVGLRRTNNQDSHVVQLATSDDAWLRNGHLFIVADGMGAHAAGELASKLAVDTIPLTYQKNRDKPAHVALQKAIQEANQVIHNRGQANPDFHGMGTTTSALLLLPRGAIVAHVGDSRVYRLRGSQLDQLSFDHSLVWELTAAGQITAGNPHVPRNIITRSLGPNPDVEVDLEGPFPVTVGDVFLLCSDGLSGEVRDEEIGTILQCLPPEEAVQLLVDMANLRGGPDNITVIVARVMENLNEGVEAGAGPTSRGIPLLVWLAMGLSVAVAGVLAALSQPLPALIVGVVGVVLTLLLNNVLSKKGDELPRARLGRGPHRTYNCQPELPFTQELARIFEQLRAAAIEEDWRIDWSHIDQMTRAAQQAVGKKDFPAAVAAYGRTISFLMRELKRQSVGPAGA